MFFERQLEPIIAAELEAILSERRSGHVPAEPLDLGSVAPSGATRSATRAADASTTRLACTLMPRLCL